MQGDDEEPEEQGKEAEANVADISMLMNSYRSLISHYACEFKRLRFLGVVHASLYGKTRLCTKKVFVGADPLKPPPSLWQGCHICQHFSGVCSKYYKAGWLFMLIF